MRAQPCLAFGAGCAAGEAERRVGGAEPCEHFRDVDTLASDLERFARGAVGFAERDGVELERAFGEEVAGEGENGRIGDHGRKAELRKPRARFRKGEIEVGNHERTRMNTKSAERFSSGNCHRADALGDLIWSSSVFLGRRKVAFGFSLDRMTEA